MYWLTALALLAAQEARAAPSSIVERGALPVSDHTLALTPVDVVAGSSKALLAAVAKSAPLKSADGGSGFTVATTLGSQTFPLIFDTGSSDLWVAKKGIKCVGKSGKSKPAKFCDFGPEFSGTYSEGTIPDKNFYIEYGDGEMVEGGLGYEPVTIAGIKVAKQEISLATRAYFLAGGVSGIVGFAYDDLTSQYPGNPPKKDNPKTDETYTNFIYNAIHQAGIAPLFTVVLERGSSGSTVTLGGVPSAYSGLTYTSTPIVQKAITPINGEANHYSYYTIIPKGVVVNGKSIASSDPGIVDTGTTLLYLNPTQAKAINAAFVPAAVEQDGLYFVECSAKAPTVGVTIGGKTFNINSADLFLPDEGNVCVSGVQSSGSEGFSILGDVFLKNVVAVFDRGAGEMKFASHENY